MLTDFQNPFTGRLSSRPKFATKSYFNISAHLKYVATLPYEIQKMAVLQKELKHTAM